MWQRFRRQFHKLASPHPGCECDHCWAERRATQLMAFPHSARVDFNGPYGEHGLVVQLWEPEGVEVGDIVHLIDAEGYRCWGVVTAVGANHTAEVALDVKTWVDAP